MKDVIRLLRVKHYIKNLLVFVPLAFSGGMLNAGQLARTAVGFVAFCLVSSCIYIVNDARDIEKDRAHPVKKNRPMASGAVSRGAGIACAAACFAVSAGSVLCLVLRGGVAASALGWLLAYFALNLAYSFGLKNVPVIDIIILMSGFLIRILFGAVIADTFVSSWLYLTVMSGAFYFGLGKRRNEIARTAGDATVGATRAVLAAYSHGFLDKFMYVSLGMANVFYALWAKEHPKRFMVLTVPLVVVICMQYSLDVEGDSDGDPVEVLLRDKKLLAFCALFAASLAVILYVL